jgi:endonuclease/exonuclease/phosphatase family metal-dependent hydrolase
VSVPGAIRLAAVALGLAGACAAGEQEGAGDLASGPAAGDLAASSATEDLSATIGLEMAGARQVKLLTWNVQYGQGTDEAVDLDRQARTIHASAADVVCLNEVTPEVETGLRTALAGLGGSWDSSGGYIFEGTTQGNAIFARRPFAAPPEWRRLVHWATYPRLVVHATIVVDGTGVDVFCTHLDHNDATVRAMQVTEVKDFADDHAEPRFILGDLNASPRQGGIDGFWSAADGHGAYAQTWEVGTGSGTAVGYFDNPASEWRTRRSQLDHILYSTAAAVTLLETRLPDLRAWTPATTTCSVDPSAVKILLNTSDDLCVRPSDHNLVTATFQLP